MIAHLGMYDLPQANARFWSHIRAALGDGPDLLSTSEDVWSVWRDPDLLFAQTCGYPYRSALHVSVGLVATPDYGLPGCPPAYYNSVIVSRDGRRMSDLDGKTMAFNDPISQSGWAAPILHLADDGFAPGAVLETGSHAASATAVAEGVADFAAVDALTWVLMQKAGHPACASLAEIAVTEPTPGLPYITGPRNDVGQVRDALEQAFMFMPQQTRDALHLNGLHVIEPEVYLAVPNPPPPTDFPNADPRVLPAR